MEQEKYSFPYEPYEEQRKLMRAIHECISSSAVGCFESPTGTGKSLSSICASFTWLLQEERRILEEIKTKEHIKENNESTSDDWLAAFLAPKDENVISDNKATMEKVRKYEEEVARIAKSNQQAKTSAGDFFVRRASKLEPSRSELTSTELSNDNEDDEFALKHYDSEEERRVKLAAALVSDSDSSDSDASNTPLSSTGTQKQKQRPRSLQDQLNLPQIYYCSRTHSQLAQFVAEIHKTEFAKRHPITGISPIRCITLGSRRNMCINPKVNRLKAEGSMSEACLEMQKPGSKVTKMDKNPTFSTGKSGVSLKKSKLRDITATKCAYHVRSLERTLSDRVLGQLRDIEDTVTLGEGLGACPYYASREAVRAANVVCLPYNMLLSKEMRESLGIDITGKVIIIDEAHNLIETINQIHSAELNVTQIDSSLAAVTAYLRRYQTQLSGKNLYYVNILCAVLRKIRKVLCPKPIKPKPQPLTATSAPPLVPTPTPVRTTDTLTVNDFLFKSNLDGVNLFKLKRHITETNLVNKIGGFAEAHDRKDANKDTAVHIHTAHHSKNKNNNQSSGTCNATRALRNALGLLVCLTNMEGDGRVFIDCVEDNHHDMPISNNNSNTSADACSSGVSGSRNSVGRIKYILLNPSVHFEPIVQHARSVLLLGGTMQPFSYFNSILFPQVEVSRLRFISCEHVVPAAQVGALIVPISGNRLNRMVNFEFTYTKRMLPEVTTALFYALLEICENTPGGVVVFCTSFAYLDALMSRWKKSKLFGKLDAVKRVFAESHASSSNTPIADENENQDNNCNITDNNIWESYQRCVTAHPNEGAVLFSVINGKLSEGINFSDDLARCVVVVGLPYPDVRDPELQEKMNFVSLKDTAVSSGGMKVAAAGNVCINAAHPSAAISTTTATAVVVQSAAGRRLCENMCMKAVNQSIGRAIRHAQDYACVVLLDRRYQQEQFSTQLPKWILRSAQLAHSSGAGGGGGGAAGSGGAASISTSGLYDSVRSSGMAMNNQGIDTSVGARLRQFFACQTTRIHAK